MAAMDSTTISPLKSALEHISMCEKHNFIIDIICKDCDKFICSKCAKTDHIEHDWDTISTAASIKRRGLNEFLDKIQCEYLDKIDEEILKTEKQMDDNQTFCDSQVSKLQKHVDAIVSRIPEMQNDVENTLRARVNSKNAQMNETKSDLEKEKKMVMDLLKFLDENYKNMSDFSLIDNIRDMDNLLANKISDIPEGKYSMKYKKGDINKKVLELVMGKTYTDEDDLITEIDKNHVSLYSFILAAEYIYEGKCSLL